MGNIERSPVAIVHECRQQGCEFQGGIARAECIQPGHETVGVDYVRADLHRGAIALIERAVYPITTALNCEAHPWHGSDAARKWLIDAARLGGSMPTPPNGPCPTCRAPLPIRAFSYWLCRVCGRTWNAS